MDNIKNLRTWVEIDKKSLISNLKTFKKLVGFKTELMAVVKANAYGHGLIQIAELFSSSERQEAKNKKIWFGVDSIEEAIVLRKAGIKNKILVLGWIPQNRFPETLKYNLSFVFYNLSLLKYIALKPYRVHLKIETGFNRQGITLEDLRKIALQIKNSSVIVEGIYTHFADSENIKSDFWRKQLERLEKAGSILAENGIFPLYIHCASSAAAILYPESHKNLIRIGIGLYGLWPSSDIKDIKNNLELKPVLTWKTKIAQIKSVGKNETIGYGRTYAAKKGLKIAVLPVGYYDGYDRGLSNKGEVLIRGKRTKVIGRICMNMTIIDANGFPNLKVGDEVILLGGRQKNRISAEEIAKKIDTINYEIIARINLLIPRIIR